MAEEAVGPRGGVSLRIEALFALEEQVLLFAAGLQRV